MPKKYLTKSDKAFNRVNPDYALKLSLRSKELLWLNEHRQNVIDTLPKRLAHHFASYDFTGINKQDVQSIFIHGKAGVGKTVLSAYLYVEFVRDLYIKRGGIAALKYNYVIFPNFIEEMQNLFLQSTLFEKAKVKQNYLIHKYSNCDILVLDDFGTKKITEYVYSLIYLVINQRYLNMLPTIINSNLSLPELGEYLSDDRIPRRIDEDYLLIDKADWKTVL